MRLPMLISTKSIGGFERRKEKRGVGYTVGGGQLCSLLAMRVPPVDEKRPC